jgi:glycosyltransferase involved in cell wall biosynthesis
VNWAIITGEYPPQVGGVSDYTRLLARALAAIGDEVTVWAPACSGPAPRDPGVMIHRLGCSSFGLQALAELNAALDRYPRPHRILVQYVPHAFGWKAMNLPFCLWLWSRRRTPIDLMYHEVVFPLSWSQPFHHQLLGLATRLMAYCATGSAQNIFISTPAWEKFIQPFDRKKRLTWLPIPSNIPTEVNADDVAELRRRLLSGDGALLGCFGTYGQHTSAMLRAIIPALLEREQNRRVLLAGRGGHALAQDLVNDEAALRERVITPGNLAASEVSRHLAACDLLLQPYPDGISSRRGSSMAGLALGIPIVTNEGALSEALWRESGAVALAQNGSAQAFIATAEELLASRERRDQLCRRATSLYRSSFTIEHTVSVLRQCASNRRQVQPACSTYGS